jgi:hypothetical protein
MSQAQVSCTAKLQYRKPISKRWYKPTLISQGAP